MVLNFSILCIDDNGNTHSTVYGYGLMNRLPFCTVARVKFIYYHMKGNEVHQAGCFFEEYKILEIWTKMLRIPEIHFDYCAI